LSSVATAKAALFTTHGLAAKSKQSKSAKVVAGPFSQFERFAQAAASSQLPAEERSLWEAAIQLDLVTVRTAEAQVTQGRTLAAWMAGQPRAGGCKGHPPKTGDKALLLALGMFNLLVLVALAAAIGWVFGLI
jgi:hypothetical protein